MREKLVKALFDGWRIAENHYLQTGDCLLKDTIGYIERACELSEEEEKDLYEQCYNAGI